MKTEILLIPKFVFLRVSAPPRDTAFPLSPSPPSFAFSAFLCGYQIRVLSPRTLRPFPRISQLPVVHKFLIAQRRKVPRVRPFRRDDVLRMFGHAYCFDVP